MTTVERLAEAQRELQTIADDLLQARTSKRSVRRDQGRRLNAVNASLRTVELLLRQDEPDWVAQFLQPPVDDDSVYCASRRAIVAATHAYAEATRELASSKGLAAAFIAAHHPDLGVDRSVCLRDVLELLDRPSGEITDRLRGALEEIRDHARDEDWWESRAVCDNAFHTTRDPRPIGQRAERYCPDCFSSWWATDGSLPGDASYAIEAVARKALHA